ncbi:MAG: efflux transporter periplasmic adaptor subunit [Halothiobacillus sp. 14-56-357]|jgi:membrane fusion protein (multidrug efflux system)|uniref:efflux RND transporter periplasmic adaptor subunit n=1 Tax=Halothiobacillus sp. 15-55-196 TaxID=1970382 RepID=UPI000BD04EEF|nr:efflux RND transporter periplasmic adaptor subunit [Halothiobacillus sp. 15-55-196]OZB35243.1 MAG: efflux transporter periplasmic adaptor subunit [Halothiobacillus sp. 15-55-196]OZB56436.1 MAG: efflux transporter periplasmic adaptor subunit [Halothiobacillus sp. 14-56-357]OZB78189.1 MAG: efflux transporter periplasmic adaptor subunit [Halothiobacillus sp. 13-55-115]
MKKGTPIRMIIMLLLVALVFGGIYGFQQFRNEMISKAIRGKGIPPQAVSTIVVKKEEWQPKVDVIGSLQAEQSTQLATEVSGLITQIHFKSGQTVKAGEKLLELNDAPLKAQLAQLQAAATLARQNLTRDQAQLKINAVSRAVVESDQATLKSAEAQVKQQEALIDQKILKAPFAGKLGIRKVDLGEYLSAGTAVVSLQKLDPMYVDFTIPQSELSLVTIGKKISIQTNAFAGKTFEGKITAIEPQVDTSTRNITVRAAIANPDGMLMPGLFVTAHVDQGEPQQYLTLPSTAIAYNPYGSTVFVVKDEGKDDKGKPKLTVEQRVVTTGPTRGDQVAVLSGLKAGETVVTAGQLKLRNGAPVFINNSIQPLNNPHPEVKDQ